MNLFHSLKKLTTIQRLVIGFCLLAAIRVFIYSASYPFISNVDEWAHIDMVLKYSHGHIPKSLETVSPEAASYIVNYSSPEYMFKPDSINKGQVPQPLWKQPKAKVQPGIDRDTFIWGTFLNPESTQPPLYYFVAGMWIRLGSLFGLNGIRLLYWIRFLNVILIAVLVWLAYLSAKALFPENKFIMLGVPLLVAIIPQDAFYSIQSDVLSPVCFGLVMIGMIKFMRDGVPSLQTGILSGLALAATVFVKTSNLPLVALVMLFLMYKAFLMNKKRMPVSAYRSIVMFALCALIPVFIWFAWNLYHYGDLTASATKIQHMGWTYKSFSDIFKHPFFSIGGGFIFWALLISTFWRGEIIWSAAQVALPATDTFFWLSTLVFLVIAVVGIHRLSESIQQRMSWFSIACFMSLVFFLLLLSLIFDFGNCPYPSRLLPFFVSGRLISAALIPFLLLYVQGVKRSLFWIKNESIQFAVLVAIAIFITLTEIIVNWPVFGSQYNFFHL